MRSFVRLRQTARRLLRAPGFTASAALTLMLGIGGTTAVFTVVNGVLLRPLPYAHADRLVDLSHTLAVAGSGKWNDAGITPTIVRPTPSTIICRPITDGSPPSFRFHSDSPMSTTGAAPGCTSASLNARPERGPVSSTRNTPAVMSAAGTRSASPLPAPVAVDGSTLAEVAS